MPSQKNYSIKTALISVSDKSNLVELAQFLQSQSIKILSTGGSAKMLAENGIEVIEVSDFTGFPEIMAGRVKTLQPKIHGGILARRDLDQAVMNEHGIEAIDLVVVNLYPFAETIAREDCTLEMAIENIDIGGPAMIRSAAKNYHWVSVLTSPKDYQNFINAYNQNQLDEKFRYQLALKAFGHTANYDRHIFDYLNKNQSTNQSSNQSTNQSTDQPFANQITLNYQKIADLRYGENPHQKAATYEQKDSAKNVLTGLARMNQLQGKALSYNNYVDTDAAYACLSEFNDDDRGNQTRKACVIVKHANPCGVALADDLLTAYQKAYRSDPTSAFGGILAFNDQVNEDLAKAITAQQFAEVIIAPDFSEAASEIFAKKKDLRLITNPIKNYCDEQTFKKINGLLLVQQQDNLAIQRENLVCVSEKSATSEQVEDLIFAFKVAKHVKSNAIVYAKNASTLGIGAGQMSRIYAAKIAQIKASDESLNLNDSVMASDAFFPFKDSITMATAAGVSAIIQPGGSLRDDQVIEEANRQGIAMYFSHSRHFKH